MRLTLNEALKILMECASRDSTGSGQGYRSTTDEWREKVSKAWAVAFKRVNKREPESNDYFNACINKARDNGLYSKG